MFFVQLEHAVDVDVADDVDVVKEKGLVETRGVFEEKPRGALEATAGVEEEIVFTRDLDAKAEVVAGAEEVYDLIGEMVDVDDELGDAEGAEAGDSDLKEREAVEFDESFGARVS